MALISGNTLASHLMRLPAAMIDEAWGRLVRTQELQNDSGADVSSDGGSPKGDAGGSAAAPADKARVSGGGLAARRISGRFSQEAFDAKEQELSFLQQRCMQFEV